MQCDNAFFRLDDPKVDAIAGHELLPGWWSRFYEYPWALQFARPGQIVADMGCGWHFRPFKDALGQIVGRVYAIDGNREVLDLPAADNVWLVHADFTKKIPLIEDGCLDRVFCISVLEDLQEGNVTEHALEEFGRILRPDGKIIATFDVPFDSEKECGPYPGIDLRRFIKTVDDLGMAFEGSIDLSKENLVVNEAFNLCVFHAVIVQP